MSKVIPMHTKPLKHAKYNEIITKYINGTQFVQQVLLMSHFGLLFDALRKPYFACANFSMSSITSPCQKPLRKLKMYFKISFPLICLVIFWLFGTKWTFPFGDVPFVVYLHTVPVTPRCTWHRRLVKLSYNFLKKSFSQAFI